MRCALLVLIIALASVLAFDVRFQSARFIGKVVSIEKTIAPSTDTRHKELWKAVVKVEKVEEQCLDQKLMGVTNLTDEVSIYYDLTDRLTTRYDGVVQLTTNRTYKFQTFAYPCHETNRVSLSVFGGSITAQ